MPGHLKSQETLFIEKFLDFFKNYDAIDLDEILNFQSLHDITSYDEVKHSIIMNMNNRSSEDFEKIVRLVPIAYKEDDWIYSYLINWFEQTIIFYLTW